MSVYAGVRHVLVADAAQVQRAACPLTSARNKLLRLLRRQQQRDRRGVRHGVACVGRDRVASASSAARRPASRLVTGPELTIVCATAATWTFSEQRLRDDRPVRAAGPDDVDLVARQDQTAGVADLRRLDRHRALARRHDVRRARRPATGCAVSTTALADDLLVHLDRELRDLADGVVDAS